MTEKQTILLDELIVTRFTKAEQQEIQREVDRLLEKVRLTERKQKNFKIKKLKRRCFAKICHR